MEAVRPTNVEEEQIPIACLLPEEKLRERVEVISENIFDHVQEMRELPNGYEYRFPADMAWAARILNFIEGERECCPFFTFEMRFEPQQGPIWLTIRGPEGTKEFLDSFGG